MPSRSDSAFSIAQRLGVLDRAGGLEHDRPNLAPSELIAEFDGQEDAEKERADQPLAQA